MRACEPHSVVFIGFHWSDLDYWYCFCFCFCCHSLRLFPPDRDDEHLLIQHYCQSLNTGSSPSQPRSPAQILISMETEEKGELEKVLNDLEQENRYTQKSQCQWLCLNGQVYHTPFLTTVQVKTRWGFIQKCIHIDLEKAWGQPSRVIKRWGYVEGGKWEGFPQILKKSIGWIHLKGLNWY